MNIYIFGAGKMAKEVEWLISRIGGMTVVGYVEHDMSDAIGKEIAPGVSILSESNFYAKARTLTDTGVAIANGTSAIRAKIAGKLRDFPNIETPPLIDPSTLLDKRPGAVRIGRGTIILAGVTITTNVEIGQFTLVNPGCTISHDVQLGDYATLSPGVHVCGSVTVGAGTLLGAGAVLRDGITVGSNSIVGMGGVAVSDVASNITVVGVPAKERKQK